MGSQLRQALGLGFELIGFILLGYMVHEPVAEQLGWEPNISLAVLSALGFIFWLIHFAVYASRQKD